MKNKYSMAYIGAVIALPIALLFIVPAVATTNASFNWGDQSGWDTTGTFAESSARADAWASSNDDSAEAWAHAESEASAWASGEDSGVAYAEGSSEAEAWANNHGEAGAWADAEAEAGAETGSTDDEWNDHDSWDNGDWGSYAWGESSAYAYAHGEDCDDEEEVVDWCDAHDCNDDVNWCDDHDCGDHNDCDDDCNHECTGDCDNDYNWCDDHDCTPAPAPTCDLNVLDATITSGDEATLVWTTDNADSVSISNIGYASLNGSEAVYPTHTLTYVLTATGDGGTATCSETVVVTEEVEDPVVSCDTFTASDWYVNKGDSVRLDWSTTGAESVQISQGVGSVALDGNTSVILYTDTQFTLTARTGAHVDTCQITVGVDEGSSNTNTNTNTTYYYYSSSHHTSSNNNDDVSCDSFTVSDSNVEEGDEVTLRWRTTDADDVDINQGVGDVSDDGSEEVTINRDTTFTLTARNNGSTDTCRVTVRVDEDEDSDGDLRCEFTVSDDEIYAGQSVVLSWINKYTDRLVLKEGTKTLVDTKKDKDVDEDVDAMTVHPDKTTKYILDVYKGNKKETCTLNVEVGKKGVVSGISLSKVPYTGFDAGPTLTALFYVAIALWGIILAYVLVIKKKQSRAFTK